jgi:hypothetical protein
VNYYGIGGYNCGGWNTAGAAAAGVAVGVATGSANTANAYNAGVVAGATGTAAVAVPASGGFARGAVYATVPAGCITPSVHGSTYCLCGNTWFQPSYGANGVYYRVVPPP